MSDPNQNPGPAIAPPTVAQLYDSLQIPRDSQCIRVLDIPEKSSATGEGLAGSLRLVDLKDSPRFTALSYVWGKASGKSINCNGYEVNVSDSCLDALFSLRETLGSFTIWVDAICINQADEEDKAAQIPLMEEIYTWATATYVWLGPVTERTKKTVDYVRMVSQYRLFPMGIPWRSGDRSMSIRQEQTQLYQNIHTGSYIRDFKKMDDWRFNCDWVSLRELVDHDWLRRSWTFQEIALASNPVLVFGQKHVTWREWQQAIAWINDFITLGDSSTVFITLGDNSTVVSKLRSRACLWPIQTWLSLCNIWQILPRPCSWNGDRFREVPDKEVGLKNDCSVREYCQCLDSPGIERRARLSVNVLHCLTFSFFFLISGMLIKELEYRKPRPGVLYLWDHCILGIRASSSFFIWVWLHATYWPKFGTPWLPFSCMSQSENSGQRNHLVGLIRVMRERECSLNEDRVFAVGAILKRLGIHQPTPNYRKSTGEIYRDSLIGLIEWDPSFISLLIDSGSPLPGAPSWVPDWSTVAKRSWLSSSYIYDAIQAPQRPDETAPVSISGNTLSVHAAYIYTATYCTVPFRSVKVDAAGDMLRGMEENLLHNTQVLCHWVTQVRRDILVDSTYESIPLGLLSVLNMHHTPLHSMDANARQVFNKVYSIMIQHSGQLRSALEATTGIVPATRAIVKDMATEKPCLDFIINRCNKLAGKRGLFLCSNGRLGSGPETMLEGDLITVVKGVAVPIVLRQQSGGAQRDAYTVVGPSFIDGLMEFGVEGLRKIDLNWQRVDLV